LSFIGSSGLGFIRRRFIWWHLVIVVAAYAPLLAVVVVVALVGVAGEGNNTPNNSNGDGDGAAGLEEVSTLVDGAGSWSEQGRPSHYGSYH
jgi:hypothetical protein